MKTALITGASRGIGRAIAQKFAQNQSHLVLNCYQSTTVLNDFAETLRQTYHIQVITCIGDVSDHSFVSNMVHTAINQFGHIDVLVNNAGVSYIGLFSDMSYEQWQKLMNTNVSSVFSCCKCVIPSMVNRKSGHIVNISSVWGKVGASCEVAYSASKGAVNALTKGLAKELAPSNIQVNAIACGAIDTDMNACFSEEERTDLESEIPAGRYGTPTEVADLVYQLACASSYLTGQVITFDGGWT